MAQPSRMQHVRGLANECTSRAACKPIDPASPREQAGEPIHWLNDEPMLLSLCILQPDQYSALGKNVSSTSGMCTCNMLWVDCKAALKGLYSRLMMDNCTTSSQPGSGSLTMQCMTPVRAGMQAGSRFLWSMESSSPVPCVQRYMRILLHIQLLWLQERVAGVGMSALLPACACFQSTTPWHSPLFLQSIVSSTQQ